MPPIKPAPTIANITVDALRRHIAAKGGPLRLTGLVRHWPANQWDAPGLGTLRTDVGEDTGVDVELGPRGRGYLDNGWQRVTMGFGLFLDAFIHHTIPGSDLPSAPAGYLAQAPLLDLPGLRAAVPPLDHYNGPQGDVYGRTLWVGPRGSFTPFHRDPNEGLYTQISGRKVFHLLPPEAGAVLPKSTRHPNTSTVPISVRRVFQTTGVGQAEHGEEGGEGEEEQGQRWDGYEEGEDVSGEEREVLKTVLREAFELGAVEARLGPGDSVLIPEGWWHSAEGETVGVGVNAWFR